MVFRSPSTPPRPCARELSDGSFHGTSKVPDTRHKRARPHVSCPSIRPPTCITSSSSSPSKAPPARSCNSSASSFHAAAALRAADAAVHAAGGATASRHRRRHCSGAVAGDIRVRVHERHGGGGGRAGQQRRQRTRWSDGGMIKAATEGASCGNTATREPLGDPTRRKAPMAAAAPGSRGRAVEPKRDGEWAPRLVAQPPDGDDHRRWRLRRQGR